MSVLTILRPDSVSGSWLVEAGGETHLDSVSDGSEHSYVGADAILARDTLTFDDLPASVATVTQVRFLASVRRAVSGSSTLRLGWTLGATTITTDWLVTGTVFANIGTAIARPGGGSWTVADVASLTAYYELRASGAPTPDEGHTNWVADAWLEVVSPDPVVGSPLPVADHTVALARRGSAQAALEREAGLDAQVARPVLTVAPLKRNVAVDAGLLRAAQATVTVEGS